MIITPFKSRAHKLATRKLRDYYAVKRLRTLSVIDYGQKPCACGLDRHRLRYQSSDELGAITAVDVSICFCAGGVNKHGGVINRFGRKIVVPDDTMKRWRSLREYGDYRRIADDIGCHYRTVQNVFLTGLGQKDMIAFIDEYYQHEYV